MVGALSSTASASAEVAEPETATKVIEVTVVK